MNIPLMFPFWQGTTPCNMWAVSCLWAVPPLLPNLGPFCRRAAVDRLIGLLAFRHAAALFPLSLTRSAHPNLFIFLSRSLLVMVASPLTRKG